MSRQVESDDESEDDGAGPASQGGGSSQALSRSDKAFKTMTKGDQESKVESFLCLSSLFHWRGIARVVSCRLSSAGLAACLSICLFVRASNYPHWEWCR